MSSQISSSNNSASGSSAGSSLKSKSAGISISSSGSKSGGTHGTSKDIKDVHVTSNMLDSFNAHKENNTESQKIEEILKDEQILSEANVQQSSSAIYSGHDRVFYFSLIFIAAFVY